MTNSRRRCSLTDPNRLPAVEIAFLNGVDRPTVEKTDADFNTLGVQFRGFIDFGVREQDQSGTRLAQWLANGCPSENVRKSLDTTWTLPGHYLDTTLIGRVWSRSNSPKQTRTQSSYSNKLAPA